jgi:hypothetical protein
MPQQQSNTPKLIELVIDGKTYYAYELPGVKHLPEKDVVFVKEFEAKPAK